MRRRRPRPWPANHPTASTDRRRVWITGIGLVTPIGIGRDAFWAGLKAGRFAGPAIDRFDPSPFRSQVAAQVDDFDPLGFMDARTARGLDRFSQFSLAAGREAMTDAALQPGARGHARADRIGVYIGSALGGIAYAEEQHVRFLDRGIRTVAPNLALAVFGGAAPANLGIALGIHGPDPVDCQLVRVRGGGARGGAQPPPRWPGRRRARRRRGGAAQSHSHSGRSTSSGPSARGTTTAPRGPPDRSTATATGSSWAKARRCWCWRTRDPASGEVRNRMRSCSAMARPPTRTTWSSREPMVGEAARAASIALADGASESRRDRLRQRPRLVDPARRRGRGAGHLRRPRRARGADVPVSGYQGDIRASARRLGRHRSRDLCAGHRRWVRPGVGQPDRSRPRIRRHCCRASCARVGRGPIDGC